MEERADSTDVLGNCQNDHDIAQTCAICRAIGRLDLQKMNVSFVFLATITATYSPTWKYVRCTYATCLEAFRALCQRVHDIRVHFQSQPSTDTLKPAPIRPPN